jgi:hypothetical protein
MPHKIQQRVISSQCPHLSHKHTQQESQDSQQCRMIEVSLLIMHPLHLDMGFQDIIQFMGWQMLKGLGYE